MKWILLAFQLLSSHRTLMQSRALVEKAKDAAEKSKKMAFFSFTLLIFLIYFIAGSIVIAVNLGTQADSGNYIVWSGTLWAGTGLILFGLAILSIGAIVLKFPSDSEDEKKVAHQQPQDLGVLLNQLAVTFVSTLVKSLTEKVETAMQAQPRQQTQTQQRDDG